MKIKKWKKIAKKSSYVSWLDDLKSYSTEEEKKIFILRSLKSKEHLHIFGRYFFPNIIKGHDDVPECHIDLLNELTARKDSAIIFPRGFAKTTWEKIDTIHDIVYALEPVILYISDTLQSAQFHFESIKSELENNNLLIHIYGWLVPERANLSHKWTNRHFETTNGINVVARGAGKGRGVNIKNQRPTKIVLDDIETDDAMRSPDQRQKLHNWLYKVIFPCRDKEKGFIKMVGTVLSTYCELIKFYRIHGGIMRKAIENGESIWPKKWTLDDLEEERQKVGSRVFSQEYLNTPINEETARIKLSWISEHYYENLKTPEVLNIVVMLDPQAGESKTADYYGLSVVGHYRKNPHRYLMRISKGRDTQLNQAALLVRTWQEYKEKHLTVIVGIEKVLSQVAVYQLVLEWKAGRIELPNVNKDDRSISVVAVEPKGKDKLARMQVHEACFERGEIHLHHTMRDFAGLLSAFPDVEHDDDIDAFIYCLDYSYKSNLSISKEGEYTKSKETIAGNLRKNKF